MEKHTNIALWASGGKDSLTLMHLARDYASDITIVHNTLGDDGFEGVTDNLIETCHTWGYTNIVITKPDLTFDQYIERFGWPSHLVPADMDGSFKTPFIGEHKVASYWHCTLWRQLEPLTRATLDLKADAIMTGTRADDGPAFARMGAVVDISEAKVWTRYNPLSSWSSDEVYDYIDAHDITLPPIYAEVKRHEISDMPDCRRCVWNPQYIQWLKDHRQYDFEYIKKNFGPVWKELQQKIQEQTQGMDILEGED